MPSLKDLLAVLDRWPRWKRIVEAPARIDALERRLAALEAAQHAPPLETCPSCGQKACRLTGARPDRLFAHTGGTRRSYRCDNCGQESERLVA